MPTSIGLIALAGIVATMLTIIVIQMMWGE